MRPRSRCTRRRPARVELEAAAVDDDRSGRERELHGRDGVGGAQPPTRTPATRTPGGTSSVAGAAVVVVVPRSSSAAVVVVVVVGPRRRRDVGDHGAGERPGGREAEHEEDDGAQTLHCASSVASAISRVVGDDPVDAERRKAAHGSGSFAVQASTGAPSRWAAATAAREQRLWCSESASARARAEAAGSRSGIAARTAAAPARVSASATAPRDAEPVARVADRDPQPGASARSDERARVGGRDERAPASSWRRTASTPRLVPRRLDVEVDADVVRARNASASSSESLARHLVQRVADAKPRARCRTRRCPRRRRPPPRATRGCSRARPRPRRGGRSRAAAGRRGAVHVRLMTTMAQSSGRSPPANPRQAASTRPRAPARGAPRSPRARRRGARCRTARARSRDSITPSV